MPSLYCNVNFVLPAAPHCSSYLNQSYISTSMSAYFHNDTVALPGVAAFMKVGSWLAGGWWVAGGWLTPRLTPRRFASVAAC